MVNRESAEAAGYCVASQTGLLLELYSLNIVPQKVEHISFYTSAKESDRLKSELLSPARYCEI